MKMRVLWELDGRVFPKWNGNGREKEVAAAGARRG